MAEQSPEGDKLLRVQTQDFLHQVETLGFDNLLKALQGKRMIFPEEFCLLLSRRFFRTAMEYAALDHSQEQIILTEKSVFAAVLDLVRDPAYVEFGLYFLQEIQDDNFFAEMYEEAVSSLFELLSKATLSYCRNPILICILLLEQLGRAQRLVPASDRARFQKKAELVEQVALRVDKKLVWRFQTEVVHLYLCRDIRNRTLLELVHALHNEALIMTHGFGMLMDYGWYGPYNTTLHPMGESTLLALMLAQPKAGKVRRSREYFLTFRNWVMRPSTRFFFSLAVSFAVAIAVQFEFVSLMEDLKGYVSELVMVPGSRVRVLPQFHVFDIFVAYSLSDAAYYMLLLCYAHLEEVPFRWSTTLVLSSVMMSVGAIMFLVVLHGDLYTNIKQIDQMANWVSLWMIGMWLRIVFRELHAELEFTEQFGVIIKTLKAMLLKTLGFSLLLGIIIYCYAAIYLMRNYQIYTETRDIQSTLFYYFSMMLGNYDTSVMFDPYDSWTMPMTVTFLVLTAIILLNLLVAMLSQIYETNENNLKLEYRTILMKFVALNLASEKYRLLNCSVPPFSLLSAPFIPFMFTQNATVVSKVVLQCIYVVFILPCNLAVFLAGSLVLAVPAYFLHFVQIMRAEAVIVKVNSESSEEPAEEASDCDMCHRITKWALFGPFYIAYSIVVDFVRAALSFTADAEPRILSKVPDNLKVEFSAGHCETTPFAPCNAEPTRLFCPPPRDASDTPQATESKSSYYAEKIAKNAQLDREIVERICKFTHHMVSVGMQAAAAEQRFFLGLHYLEVPLVMHAISKVMEKRTLDSKKILRTVVAKLAGKNEDAAEARKA